MLAGAPSANAVTLLAPRTPPRNVLPGLSSYVREMGALLWHLTMRSCPGAASPAIYPAMPPITCSLAVATFLSVMAPSLVQLLMLPSRKPTMAPRRAVPANESTRLMGALFVQPLICPPGSKCPAIRAMSPWSAPLSEQLESMIRFLTVPDTSVNRGVVALQLRMLLPPPSNVPAKDAAGTSSLPDRSMSAPSLTMSASVHLGAYSLSHTRSSVASLIVRG